MPDNLPPGGGINPQRPSGPERLGMLLGECADPDTPESIAEEEAVAAANTELPEEVRAELSRSVPPGFARESAMWKLAQELGFPLIEQSEAQDEDDERFDLFTRPMVRYLLNADWFFEHSIPWCMDDSPVPGGLDPDETPLEQNVIAWSKTHVLFTCERGACVISRPAWDDGWRGCSAC